MKDNWLIASTIIGYLVVLLALMCLVAPVSDVIINDLNSFGSTLDWLLHHVFPGI